MHLCVLEWEARRGSHTGKRVGLGGGLGALIFLNKSLPKIIGLSFLTKKNESRMFRPSSKFLKLFFIYFDS